MSLPWRETGPTTVLLKLSLILFLAGSVGLRAQTTPAAITLAATTSPAAVQPGVTVVTLVISNPPSGTITPANLRLAIELAAGVSGPSLSATVTAYATLLPAGGRITFQVTGPNVAAPTPYLVSVSGTTSTGIAFASSKPASMTVIPPAQILSVVPASGQPGQTLQVTITGQYTNYVQASTNANFGAGISIGTASIGQSGFVTVSSPTTASVQLTISPGAAPGPRNVTVATGVQTATAVGAFTVTAPSPTLLSITPNSGTQGQNGLPVSIIGLNTHFANTSTIGLGTGVTASNVVSTDATHLSAQLSIDGAAVAGTRTVSVTSGSEFVTLPNAFTVRGLPAITQVTPNMGPQGKQNLSVTITAQNTHFAQGTTIASLGAGITIVSLTVTSLTGATAILNIDPATPTGARNVAVTTGSEVVTLNNGFTVTNGVPILLSVNPNTGKQGHQSLPVTLVGQFTHFQQGISQASFGGGITVVSLTVNSPTSATAVLSIDSSAATGGRTVAITTASEIATLNNGFTVNPSTPISLSVNPNTGQQGRQNMSVTLTGQSSHFLQGVSQANFGAGVSLASLIVNSPTSATAILNIDSTAAPGGRTVTLATNGEVGTLSNGFTVTAGTPTLVSVTPNSGQQGQQNLPVIISGQFTHFLQGTTQANFGAGVTVASVTVTSITTATVLLNIDASAVSGARTVLLTTGAEVAILANGFTVTPSVPVLLSVTPNTGQQGAQNLPVTIVGQFTHFLQGTSQANFGAGITVASLTVNSPTSAAAIVNLDYSAAAGPRTVTLTTGTEVATLGNGFTVTVPTPVLVSVTPSSGQQGTQGLPVAITGKFTHFLQGSSQASLGAGISVVSIIVNSFTSATAVINIDPTTTPGSRSLTVTTGTETETLANAFTVTSPSIGISVSPSPGNFGNVPITTSSQKTFTITSTGTSPLTVSSISIVGAFFTLGNLPSLPLVVAPSGAASFSVTFAPLGTTSSNASVTISSNATIPSTSVQLSGTGTAPPTAPAAAITVVTDHPVYRRVQPVQISGALTSSTGTGISNIPVAVQVSINGSTRTFNPYTDAQGTFRTTFQPAATDGGTFSVTATAESGGSTRTASTTFRIFGLLVSPSSLSQDQVMGTSVPVPLSLQNVGDASLNNVHYSATVSPAGSLSVSFPQTIATLGTGALVTVPVTLTAPSGNPPPTPVTVQMTITSVDSISGVADSEPSTFTITLRPAVSTLTLIPASLSVGVNPGGNLTRRFLVQNSGYVVTNNSTVTLQDPATFNWVSLGNASLGNLAPGASKEFQVLINSPATQPLGNYTVLFNVSGGTNPLQGTVNISVTQSTLGSVAFTVSDDTGAKVGGASIALYGKTNGKVFKGVTASNGQDFISGVDAGDYSYVVAAALHDPATGSVTVTANATAQVNVLLTYDVVSLSFTVTPTTIVDQYTVALNITYSTHLPKPALKVVPPNLNFSFFPGDLPGGKYPCSLSITNTHSTAVVRNVMLDTSQLDLGQPNGQAMHVQFEDGSNVYQVGTLIAQASATVACYATADGNNVPTHTAGSIVVKGNYDFSLDGNLLQGTTSTEVPVSYTRPSELSYDPIPFIYDATDPANPVLKYGGGSFVYSVKSQRSQVLNLLKPSGPLFGGHNLVAFTATLSATTSLDQINANQGNVFWHTDFSSLKQSLLGVGDTTTFDISTPDNGITLAQALNAQIAANPKQVLNLPSYLGFEGQWSDRASPTGYLIPVHVITVTPDTVIIPEPGKLTHIPCLNPEDPDCQAPDEELPPDEFVDGQIQIQIVQKLRLERQAFNAMLGIGAQVPLSNTVASIKIRDSQGNDASSKFFVLVTSDPLGATHGGTVAGQTSISWQLIPNAGAGGSSPQGAQYQVQATVSYVVNGTAKSVNTQTVTITVLPSPKLTVSYTAPFVVVDGKDAKIRVTIQNIGAGTAHNLSIQSAQPTIAASIPVDPTIPGLLVNFNITGSSNTAASSGFVPGNLTIDFGDVAPGATVSGYWTLRVSRRGFLVTFSSTFTHQDYQGIQLDPLVLPPTTTLIPAIGGMVTNTTGQTIPNLTVSLRQGTTTIGSDLTDATTGEYHIQDVVAGSYLEQVTDTSGKVWASQNIVVTANQPTNFIDFVLPNFNPFGTVILNAASLAQTYDGTPKLVTATTTPPGLTVNLTYGGSFIPPAAAGVYNVVGTISDTNYVGTASGALTVSKATPMLTWATPAPIVYGTALSSTQLNAAAVIPGVSSASQMGNIVSSRQARSAALAFPSNHTAGIGGTNLQSNATPINAILPTTLAFDSDRTGRVQIFSGQNIPLSAPHQLTAGGAGNQESRGPKWSQKTNQIAYQFGAPGTRGIHVMNPDGSAQTRVTPPPSTPLATLPSLTYPCSDNRDPSWSPDGRFIVYSCLANTGPISSGGSYDLWVHDNAVLPRFAEFPFVSLPTTLELAPAWSPNGKSIAFVLAGPGGKADVAAVGVNYDSSGNAQPSNIVSTLTKSTLDGIHFYSNFDPTWSPDGTRIAFSSTRNGSHRIFVLNVLCPEAQTGCPLATPMTSGPGDDTNPAWSPDATTIAFASTRPTTQNQSGKTQIYVIGASQPEGGANPANLISDGSANDDNPAWNQQLTQGTLRLLIAPISVTSSISTSTPGLVTVTDVFGQPVTGAAVTIIPPPTNASIVFSRLTGVTDPSGQFAFTVSEPTPLDQSYQFAFTVTASKTINGMVTSISDNGTILIVGIGPLQPTAPPGTPNQRLPLGAHPFSQRQKSNFSQRAVEMSTSALAGVMQAGLSGFTNFERELGFGVGESAFEIALGHQFPIANTTFKLSGGFLSIGLLLKDTYDFLDADLEALDAIRSLRIALDPPDSNFSSVALPVVKSPPALPLARGPLSPNTATLMNQNLGTKATIRAVLEALYTSANRYTTALGASDLASATLQRDAILTYEDTLAALFVHEADLTQNLLTSLQQDGLPNTTITTSDAMNFQEALKSSVFPSQLAELFQEGGASTSDTSAIRNSIISSDPASLATEFFGLLQSEVQTSRNMAAAFTVGLAPPGGVDNSIPGNFVYTPSAGTVLPLGNHTLAVAFTPADTANYTTANATVVLQVTGNGSPTLTQVNPNTGSQGQQNESVTLTGQFTHWVQGTTTASFGAGITVATLTINSATSATAVLNIAPAATAGARNVTLTTGAEVVTLTNAFTVTGSVCATAPSGLVSWWTGDADTSDLFGLNGASGSSAVTFVPGRVGDGFTFGSGGFIDIPASPSLANQQFTWSAWARPDGPAPNNDAFGGVIVGQAIDGTHTSVQLSWRATDNRFLFLFGDVSSESIISTTDSFAPGQFYFVTGTYDGSTFRLFVNGTLEGQRALTKTITFSSSTWTIGSTSSAFRGSGFPRTWNGVIDEVQAFNRTLSQAEIQAIFAVGSAGECKVQHPISSVVPNSGQQGQQNLSVAITGRSTNWVQGTTTATLGSGVTVASLTVNSPTSATAVLNIDPAAPTGARTITLTTASEVDTLTNGFAVTAGAPALTQVTPNAGLQGQQSESVTLAGQFTHWVQGTTTASFGAGITVGTLTINSATSATAVLNIDGAAAIGARNVTVTTNAEVVTLTNGFTVTATNGTPVLTQVNPNTAQQGQQNVSVALTGQFTHWAQGTTTASFGPGIALASLTINSVTSATAVLNIDPAAALGARNVTLTTGAEVVIMTNGFTVTNGTPVLTQVNPNTGLQGQQNESVTLSGQFTHWVQGTTTASFGAGITVATLTVNSATSATAVLNIDPAAAVGARNVTFTTGAEVVTLSNGFTVANGSPALTQVNPNTGLQGQQNESVTLTGQLTHWVQGTTTASFGAGITVATMTVNSATSATAVVNIDQAATAATRNVTLTTGAEIVTLASSFTVTAASSCVTPPAGLVSWWTADGNTNDALGLNHPSASNAISFNQAEVGKGFSFGSGGYIDFTSSASLANPQFSWAAWVRPDGPGPNNDSSGNVILEQSVDNTHVSVGLTWRAMDNRFAFAFGEAISVDVIVSQHTFAPGQFYFVTGTYDGSTFKLYVNGVIEGQMAQSKTVAYSSLFWTIGATSPNIRSQGFPRTWNGVIDEAQAFNRALSQGELQSIYAAGTAGECKVPPAITSARPNTGQQSQQNLSVALTGNFTNWVQGATTANFGAGITVVTLSVSSPTAATAVVNIDLAAAAGARTITLTTGIQVDTLSNGFTVTTGTPALTQVSPNAGLQGQQNESVSITGQFTHWVQGTTTASFGPGITVVTLTINSGTSATAVLNIDAAAPTGARNVTLTTGAEVGTLASSFTVTAATPVITLVNPNVGQQGQQNVSVTITGNFTHFIQGTTQANFGDAISVGGGVLGAPGAVKVLGPTTALAEITINICAVTGLRNLIVTTGSESVSLTGGFSVTSGSVFSQLSPTGSRPSPRTQYTSVYDGVSNRMIEFGGVTSGNLLTNEVWVLSNANGLNPPPVWVLLNPSGSAPPPRRDHVAVYDPVNNRMIMFGGVIGTGFASDVWVLSNANGLGGTSAWTQVVPQNSTPIPRRYAAAGYDPDTNRLTIFGGWTGQTALNDAWVLSNANGLGGTPAWTQLAPSGQPPPPRTATFFAFDTFSKRLILFGGADGQSSNYSNAVWVLTSANGIGGSPSWVEVVREGTSDSPSPRTSGNVATPYDPGSNRFLVVGGGLTSTMYAGSDSWMLQNANGLSGTPTWVKLDDRTIPATISAVVGAYDSSTDRLMLTGDITSNDTFVITNATNLPVASPVPSLLSVLPNSSQRGQTTSSTLTGACTSFAQGVSVVSFGAGVSVASLTVNSPTSATPALNIDGAAATGARTVTMTTGAEMATLANGFTVTSGTPVLTKVSPSTGQQGRQNLSVGLIGQFTHWVQGTTAVNFGAGITVASLTVDSQATATAVVNIDPSAPIGARTITLTTGSEVITVTNSFTVISATVPAITSITPKSTLAGTSTTVFTIGGTNLNASTFAFFPSSGITINTVSIAANGTSATFAVMISASASGRFTLVATNASGASNSTPTVGFLPGTASFNTVTIPGSQPDADPDQDGRTNSQEIQAETDPLNADTDGDNYVDGLEVALGSDPLKASSVPKLYGSGWFASPMMSILNNANPGTVTTGSTQYVSTATFSILNSLNPSTGVVGSTRFVNGPIFSILNNLNPSAGSVGLPRYAFGQIFSMLNSLNPSAGVGGSQRFVSGPTFSIINVLNPNVVVTGTQQYVSGRIFSVLNGISPRPAGPSSKFTNSLFFSLSNLTLGSATARISGRFTVGTLAERITRPWLFPNATGGDSDTDGDGISDEDEIRLGTNRFERDTDHDGYPDGLEIALGSDPLDPNSVPNISPPGFAISPAILIQNYTLLGLRIVPVWPAEARRQP